MNRAVGIAVGALLALLGCAHADDGKGALVLERTIPLPNVAGRIDHLAIDPAHTRLAVAELGNGSVDIIDLASGGVAHRITGLQEPQGIAFSQDGELIVVAEGGAGDVRLFDAKTFAPIATIPLGEDADNVRIDPRNGHAVVGYGAGALAVIDLASRKVLSQVKLPAHPEGFQIDSAGNAYVNLPDARTIVVANLDSGAQLARWSLPAALFNFPMALEPRGKGAAVVFRAPGKIAVFDRETGKETGSQGACGDSDDAFFDAPRDRIYVACGSGAVDVFDTSGGKLTHAAQIKTRSGARTALFEPTLDRLFVAARASGGEGASLLVFRPGS
jgi:DNA-binding beta-propeller fold protein YncE